MPCYYSQPDAHVDLETSRSATSSGRRPGATPEWTEAERQCCLSGTSYAEAQVACSTATTGDGEKKCGTVTQTSAPDPDCLYDVCAFGLDSAIGQSVPEMTEENCGDEIEICRAGNCGNASPPPPRNVRVECPTDDGKPPRTCLYRSDRLPRPRRTTRGGCARRRRRMRRSSAPRPSPTRRRSSSRIPGSAAGPSVAPAARRRASVPRSARDGEASAGEGVYGIIPGE